MKKLNKTFRLTPLEREKPPRLTFDPLCWLKLQYFCHLGDTEIGGFAISADDDDLYVEQFRTVMQGTTAVSVAFADSAVADYFDECIDAGLKPGQFSRVWLHSHPGDSPQPSSVDERTFDEVFGRCDWAVLFIISRTGRTYARLAFSAGPGGSIDLPVTVDWESLPDRLAEIDLQKQVNDWQCEFENNIHPVTIPTTPNLMEDGLDEMSLWYDEGLMLTAHEELSRAAEVP